MNADRSLAQKKPCAICRSAENLDVRYHLHKNARDYDVMRCLQCGLSYTDVDFESGVVEETGYYGHATTYACSVDEFQQRFQAQVLDIQKHTPEGKLLDFGCGPGFFLSVAGQAGFDAYGFDIRRGAQAEGAKRGIEKISVAARVDVMDAHAPFDVVTMFNVIEHLNDPGDTLGRLHKLLRPGGLLVVETPDENGLVRSLARMAYGATFGRVNVLDHFYELPPHHVYCFSREALNRLLERRGFQAIAIEGVNAGPEFIKHGLKAKKPGLRAVIKSVLVDALLWSSDLLDRPTRLIAYARKV